ncbi:MAG TPA: 4Fe-4S dicluster domain-containing protein [Anaerolineae bacterium]|nr:4Fe-4S dicluster domain-containing protein [Anaerolineae bacterium]
MGLYSISLIVAGCILFVFFGGFVVVSIKENETRATKIACLFMLFAVVLGISGIWFPIEVKKWLAIGEYVIVFISIIGFFLPVGKVEIKNDVPNIRFDERDIMFSRALLKQGTWQYTSYYKMRPENKHSDDVTRSKPGLLAKGSTYYNQPHYAIPEASFRVTDALQPVVEGEPNEEKYEPLNPEQATSFVISLTKYFGALEAGVTELKPYHVYSHVGRGSGTYGESITLNHDYAIAFTVEMDYAMIAANPAPPGVLESAKQYVEAARVAVQVAETLRAMGYNARAHIDGNYRVIAPLVARDAGLGEIGRIGLLITPKYGPRVRIGVITTDMPLVASQRKPDLSVIDFCNVCKKCAYNCPVRSIPLDDRKEVDGAYRWRINPDTCYRYWTVVGTDCGRCMTVCPYSHPNNIMHNLVRWGTKKSGAFRRFAVLMDDLLYGKQPEQRELVHWFNLEKEQ